MRYEKLSIDELHNLNGGNKESKKIAEQNK